MQRQALLHVIWRQTHTLDGLYVWPRAAKHIATLDLAAAKLTKGTLQPVVASQQYKACVVWVRSD